MKSMRKKVLLREQKQKGYISLICLSLVQECNKQGGFTRRTRTVLFLVTWVKLSAAAGADVK